jgi:hypothetical protein
MRIDLRQSGSTTLAASLALALTISGCKNAPATPDDATLTSQVTGRIASDPNLSGQTVQATVSSGVVTLNGSVTSDSARSIAAGDVAQVNGVRTVVNNLTVQAAAVAPPAAVVNTPLPAPVRTEPTPKPYASISRSRSQPESQPVPQPAPIVRNAPAPQPAQQAQVQPPPPPPPPAPVAHKITLAAGTTIPVRLTQTLDSSTTQQGDRFSGVVASDIVQDGLVVLPQGTPVAGRVDAVQDATHFKGSSLLTISLSSITRRGDHLEVSSEPYTKQGEGRGKNTAEKVGGGAAVGAILGGILGGGRGAAIGSVAGGGVGAGAQAATRGHQVQIPSESILRFRLTDPVVVRVMSGGEDSGNQAPGLERR